MGTSNTIPLGTGRKTLHGGKTNRKFGRAARKPAHLRYNREKRWEKNKKRRIEKEARRQARLKTRYGSQKPKGNIPG